MNDHLDRLISEVAPEEQAASYDRWFRAQVQAAIDDPRPSVPHDEAMARIRRTVEAATCSESLPMTSHNGVSVPGSSHRNN